MAWNSRNKSLSSDAVKAVGPGAPIAQNPGFAGKAYRDMWDMDRAYREGMQKVTWVARCIDAIAGNQARLPIILRKDNSRDGEILRGKRAIDHPLTDILNTKANMGENAFIFRYRLSSQLLLGTRGAFIEKIRGKDGRIIALNLLPPQSTAPIPDARRFVSGYEVSLPYGEKILMKPEEVVWIRRPHPLDPYLSLTPMESAGVAIEIENLAKTYNRNYLLNDGRPGGILVVRGEIDDDDKSELRSRFRGNIGRAGATTVISSDDGVDYVDTSANPRDAAYIQMRQIQKEEILASFGVPESVIGNASGRTFSNAAEEHRVFWNETMLPHLDLLARALDELDETYYIDFDTSHVPILILYKQERSRYYLEEFQMGLTSANEYRDATGRKKVESDLADSLLMNPNLTPIANTEKKMDQPQAAVPGMPGAPAMPGMPGMPGAPEAGGVPPFNPDGTSQSPLDPNTMQGALAAQGVAPGGQLPPEPAAPMAAAPETTVAPPPPGVATAGKIGDIETKHEQDINRWSQIMNRALERIFERQQRVVLEKSNGAKSKKSLSNGSLEPDFIFQKDVWDKQMDEDIRPVLAAVINDSLNNSLNSALPQEEIVVQLDAQMARVKSINEETTELIQEAIIKTLPLETEENRQALLRASCVSIFTNLLAKSRFEVSDAEVKRAWRFAQQIK